MFWVLRVTVSSVSVSGEMFPMWVGAGYAALFGCSFSLWMFLFRERSIFHFDISSGTYIIFMTVVTQAVKVPEVCLTRIAWTEIEKAG